MANLHHICVTEFEIDQTPSRLAGIDVETETRLRSFGCELIDDIGFLLNLPQVAISTAQTLFHRFYCAVPFTDHHVEIMAVASIFLAGKLEECMKSMRSVLSVYCCIKYRQLMAESGQTSMEPSPVLDMSTMFFHQLRQAVLAAEKLLLERLGFNTCVELPHKFLLNYLNVLQLAKNEEMVQMAWNYANDCMRTVACVRFAPEALATASIFRAAFTLNISMHEEPIPWWTLFDATYEDIEYICWLLTQLYEDPTPKCPNVTKSASFLPTSLSQFMEAFKTIDHRPNTTTQPTPTLQSSTKAYTPSSRGYDPYRRR